jgi:GxxExxY protein
VDGAVMRCAYAAHNQFGHRFNERIYENDIAARLRAEGFDVKTQVPVTVTHGSFQKTYFLDLLVNRMLYELKAVTELVPEHDMQALHYAILQDVRLVKLLNFGGDRVRGKLLPNAMHGVSRHEPKMKRTGWHPLSDACERLVRQLKDIIGDLGTHLDVRLYNEILVHSLGGEAHCLQRVEVCVDGETRGTHIVQFHSPRHAFALTSFNGPQANFLRHLEVLLRHVPALAGIQWINLNHSRVEITTVTRPENQTAEWQTAE